MRTLGLELIAGITREIPAGGPGDYNTPLGRLAIETKGRNVSPTSLGESLLSEWEKYY